MTTDGRGGRIGFGVSGGIVIVENEKELPTKNKPGKPNTLYRLIINGGKGPNGQKQDRITDGNKEPKRDTDYNHADNGTYTFPHYHDWEDGCRGDGYTVNSAGDKIYFNS